MHNTSVHLSSTVVVPSNRFVDRYSAMPETLRETFRKVSRRGSDLSSSPSHFLRTQFRKSAAFSVGRKKKEEKKNRFVHFHLDADKIFDEKLCICLCISREIISNRVNILVEIGGKGNLP